MTLLNKLLKKMYEDYAVVFPKVDSIKVQQSSLKLFKAGFPVIPTDYVVFLSMTNGLFWNGLTLFALTKQEREKGAFYHPGIMDTYAGYQKNTLMHKKLLLGYAPEELIVYVAEAKLYQILDRYTYEVILTLPRFFDVLYFYARELMEKEPLKVADKEDNLSSIK